MIRHFEILIVVQTTKYHVDIFGKLQYGVSLYTTTRRYFCNTKYSGTVSVARVIAPKKQ